MKILPYLLSHKTSKLYGVVNSLPRCGREIKFYSVFLKRKLIIYIYIYSMCW